MTKRIHFIWLLCWLFCYVGLCGTSVSLAAKANNETDKKNPSLHITVEGIEDELIKNVETRLNIAAQDVKPPVSEKNIREFYDDSLDNIHKALQPFGYFKPKIKRSLTYNSKTRHGKTWLASFYVNKGRAVKIAKVDFKITGEGKQLSEFKTLIKKVPLKKGQVLLSEAYENFKKKVINTAQRLGFMDADFTEHVIKVNLANYTANIILHFNTGPRYYFGVVNFSKSPFNLSLLKGYVPFKRGEPYTTADLLLLQTQLSGSGYFQHVSVVPQPKKIKNFQVPVDVQLIPRKSQHYTVGIGYGTDTGPRGSLGLEWRYLNAKGHHFQALIQGAQDKSNVQARYVIPGTNPVTDQYNITAAILTNDPPDGDSITAPLIGFNYLQTDRDGWQRSIGIHFQSERFSFDDEPNQRRTSNFIIPSVSWQKIKADDRINATEGYRIFINLQGGFEPTSRNEFIKSTFVQGEFQGKYIHSFNSKNRIVLRTDLGATILVKNGFRLPLSQYFYAGGASSIRGLNYQSLGRGRYLMVGSAEFQSFIHGNWGIAAFIDIGNAFTHTPIQLRRGFGLGLLYRSPIGPIELTVATAGKFNERIHGVDIQFSMGPDF